MARVLSCFGVVDINKVVKHRVSQGLVFGDRLRGCALESPWLKNKTDDYLCFLWQSLPLVTVAMVTVAKVTVAIVTVTMVTVTMVTIT